MSNNLIERLSKLADHIYSLDSNSEDAKLIYMARDALKQKNEQPVAITREHKQGCEIQFDAECSCRDDAEDATVQAVDAALRRAWGVGDKTRPQIIEAIRPFLRATEREPSEADELIGMQENVAEQLAENEGYWYSCTGCYEGGEYGGNAHNYPFSDVFKCRPGSGCRECGGIGVRWDGTDYSDYGKVPDTAGDADNDPGVIFESGRQEVEREWRQKLYRNGGVEIMAFLRSHYTEQHIRALLATHYGTTQIEDQGATNG